MSERKYPPEFIIGLLSEPFLSILKEIERVENDARLLVITTHAFVELMINYLARACCVDGKQISQDNRTYSHSVKLTILHEMKILSDNHFRLLTWFRRLRNESAHEWDFKLRPERLDLFVKDNHRDQKQFGELCSNIIFTLWRAHHKQIGPLIAPDVFKEELVDVLMMEKPAPEEWIPLKSDPKVIQVPAGE